MSLSSPTRQTLTAELLEQFLSAPLRPMWEAINAGRVYSGPVDTWLVDTVLNCRSCDDVTVARCLVQTWIQFDQQLKSRLFKCQCGGELTRDSALVKVPPLTNLV